MLGICCQTWLLLRFDCLLSVRNMLPDVDVFTSRVFPLESKIHATCEMDCLRRNGNTFTSFIQFKFWAHSFSPPIYSINRPFIQSIDEFCLIGFVLSGGSGFSDRILRWWDRRTTLQTAGVDPSRLLLRSLRHVHLLHHHIGTICRQSLFAGLLIRALEDENASILDPLELGYYFLR